MRRRKSLAASLLAALCLALTLTACAPTTSAPQPQPTATTVAAATSDFASVNPDYIYDQLAYLATHFQHREAGFDANLPVEVNGHDEFAAYWAKEMTRNLDGFAWAVRHDSFETGGWQGRPAVVPGTNVEVSVPGVVHPEQVVVIGCHYDAETTSTQSANDDASGCAIELGIAQALGSFWRARHLTLARTLRFVLFDGEEQGLFGSFAYANTTVNGDLGNITAMVNEEQNGIAYPLRYLGLAANPQMPLWAEVSPLTDSQLYSTPSQLPAPQRAAIARLADLMGQASAQVFARFQALGLSTLAYRTDSGATVNQPVFTPEQAGQVHVEPDQIGSSDQVPFTIAGLPCVTFVGNATYYDRQPPPGSYPYDQPDDTIQLMNTFADGGAQKARALTLSLALPAMLTTWLLAQDAVLGNAPASTKPVAAMSDIGQTVVGGSLALDAMASLDPNGGALNYAWDFGDGATATGLSVRHTYAREGTYTLKLTVSSPSGATVVTKTIHVGTQPVAVPNAFAGRHLSGHPNPNPAAQLPTPVPGR